MTTRLIAKEHAQVMFDMALGPARQPTMLGPRHQVRPNAENPVQDGLLGGFPRQDQARHRAPDRQGRIAEIDLALAQALARPMVAAVVVF